MKAHLESRWIRDEWAIYISERSREGRRFYVDPMNRGRFVEVSEQQSVDAEEAAAVILPTEWLDAIVAAANEHAGIRPPSTAMANHLADAVGVRDRLLAMIEHDTGIRHGA